MDVEVMGLDMPWARYPKDKILDNISYVTITRKQAAAAIDMVYDTYQAMILNDGYAPFDAKKVETYRIANDLTKKTGINKNVVLALLNSMASLAASGKIPPKHINPAAQKAIDLVKSENRNNAISNLLKPITGAAQKVMIPAIILGAGALALKFGLFNKKGA